MVYSTNILLLWRPGSLRIIREVVFMQGSFRVKKHGVLPVVGNCIVLLIVILDYLRSVLIVFFFPFSDETPG